MAWYLGMTYRRPLLRWLCRGYLPLGLVAIGLTGSRGAMVATVAALSIVPLTLTRLSAGRKVAAGFLLLIVGAVSVAFIPESSFQRFGSTKEEVEQGTLNGRLQIWTAGVHAFVQKPVLGYGAGGFDSAIVPWFGRPRAPHNSYLCILVEQGALGFLVWITDVLRRLSPGAEASDAGATIRSGSAGHDGRRDAPARLGRPQTGLVHCGPARRLLRCHAGAGAPRGSRAGPRPVTVDPPRRAARRPVPIRARATAALPSAPQAAGAVGQ